MYVRLLGPLEVLSGDGTPIELSTPRLRSLLALLALTPGRGVPADVLADRLWGGEAPPTARASVRTYVMRLRKALPELATPDYLGASWIPEITPGS